MSPTPARFTVILKPQLTDTEGHVDHGGALRSATVEFTGRRGASGFPRYSGEGMVADIDPATRTVEAVTVDGYELPYGWVAEAAEVVEAADGDESEQAGQADQAEEADQADQADRADRAEEADQAGEAGQADRADQADQADRADRAD
ncbi:hypothetical protein [Streptomyces sp. NPDC002851]